MTTTTKNKINNNTLLDSIAKVGDRVELTFLSGSAQGIVEYVSSSDIHVLFGNNKESLDFCRDQITNLQVIEETPTLQERAVDFVENLRFRKPAFVCDCDYNCTCYVQDQAKNDIIDDTIEEFKRVFPEFFK